MNLWVDDLREMPEGYDHHARTAEEAIGLVASGVVVRISLDHDLGENQATGYDVAKFIEKGAYDRKVGRLWWTVHSANPPGHKNIVDALMSAGRFWDEDDDLRAEMEGLAEMASRVRDRSEEGDE